MSPRIGDAHGTSAGARVCSLVDERRRVYKKLVVSEDGQRLLGGILVGDAEDYGVLLQMVQNGLPLPEHPEQLLLPGDAEAAASRWRWAPPRCRTARRSAPATASAKGDLCAAIAGGASSLGRTEKVHPRRQFLWRLRTARDADPESGADARRRRRRQSSLRALPVFAPAAVPSGARWRAALV